MKRTKWLAAAIVVMGMGVVGLFALAGERGSEEGTRCAAFRIKRASEHSKDGIYLNIKDSVQLPKGWEPVGGGMGGPGTSWNFVVIACQR